MGIALTGVVQGKQVGSGTDRKHALILRPELIGAVWLHRQESFLLPKRQAVNRDLSSCQFHRNVVLQFSQRVVAFRAQFDKYRHMKHAFTGVVDFAHQRIQIFQIALRFNGGAHVISHRHHGVFSGGLLHDGVPLHNIHRTVINAQRYAGAVAEPRKNRRFVRCHRILPNRPRAAPFVAHNVVIRHEFDNARRDAVEEGLCLFRRAFLRRGNRGLFFLSEHQLSFLSGARYWMPSTGGMASPLSAVRR